MGFKLGKLADYIRVQGGFAYKSKDFQNSGTKKVLKIKNIRFGYVDYNDAVYISDELAHNTHSWATREGDILISMTGSGPSAPQSLVGRVARVWAGDETAWINQRVGRIVLKAHGSIHLDFIFYLLSQKSSQDFLVANSSGSANQANISGKTIEMLPCPLISYEDSSKIATILLSLDQKINLNHQINQTLEQMAQTLFKSWFVDFDPVIDNALDVGFFEQDLAFSDELLHRVEVRKAVRESDNFKPLSEDIRRLFPNAFEECAEPALGLGGWVPKRWQISTVDDELTVKGGSTPSTANPDFWEQGNIHWTSPKDLSGSQEKIMLYTERKITELGLRKITSGLLPINTVLMSSRAPIGYLAMAKIPVAINQGYIAITTTKRLSQEYVLYWLDSSMDEIKGIAGGTTFAEISKKTFKSISMVIPDPQVIEKYTVIIKSYLNKVTLNAKERGSLEKLRDTLLPKLISGELSLSDIKIDIPEETLI
ncbi:restriction endonuclease subunit S [Proteus mirabilis]|uniref:restriction endonuclease subunit S n=1 Tax=Proteus mirabilis TaxID=584 RepID=UPI003F1B4646